MKAVHLKPLSSFNNPFQPSDTLFGAICWGIKFIHGEEELESILKGFKEGSPPFKISSTFPFKGETYYLPVPIKSTFSDEKPNDFKDMWEIKEAKKRKWIPLKEFNELINADKKLEDVLKNSEERKFVKDMIQPGNSINRLSSATEGNLFFRSVFRHSEGTELYFLLEADDEKIENEVINGLRFIEDKGLGGGSSTGHGNFEIKDVKEFDELKESEKAQRFMTLSLYMPDDEWDDFLERSDEMSYRLVKRKGVVEEAFSAFNNPWKKTVFMFTPGSVFPVIDGKDHYGKNPVVNSDEFDVQQYGYAFDIGVDLK
ncbi:MAG: type III-A CRISPR-associated RAMP protein Csm4 [Petrotogales bacterium]